MLTPTLIEHIEEFELVRRMPRQAIDAQILSGVSQLDEANELEPFLREILLDVTETAHSATEIADILTTHVTIRGVPHLAAFVNKGKATPRVTSRLVAHQVMRLQSVPGINLIVLLAVGDIQDDIKRDFLQVATNMGVDYLVVDAIDVARLLIAHHKLCSRDGTPYREGRCPVCNTAASEPIQLILNVYEAPTYETVSVEDISARIKRYKASIRTDPHYSKAVLREVIKQAVEETKRLRLFHSDQAETRFGDKDADYVRIFVYLSELDQQMNNHVCRAAWLRPELSEEHGSLSLNGDEWLGEIEIDWSSMYQELRSEWAQRRSTKEAWLKKLNETFPDMEKLMKRAKSYLHAYESNGINQSALQANLASLEPLARELDERAGSSEVAPFECEDCDNAFQGLMGRFYSTFVGFAPWVKEERNWDNKLWLLRYSTRDYEADRERFLYELGKVDRRLHRRLRSLA